MKTTHAQRYNARMDSIFEQAKINTRKHNAAFPQSEIDEMRTEAGPYDDAETLDISAGCFRRLLRHAEHRARLLTQCKAALALLDPQGSKGTDYLGLRNAINEAEGCLQ